MDLEKLSEQIDYGHMDFDRKWNKIYPIISVLMLGSGLTIYPDMKSLGVGVIMGGAYMGFETVKQYARSANPLNYLKREEVEESENKGRKPYTILKG